MGLYSSCMKKRPPSPPPDDPRRRVLDALQAGPRTWEEVAAATKLDDDKLGLILLDLLAGKKVKTLHRGGVRVYLLP